MQTVAKVNSRVENGQTSQGFYVVAADGTAYGFNNNRSIDRVLGFMTDGLKKYRANPPDVTEVPTLEHMRFAPPAGASVLRVYSRILPAPEGCNESNKNLQRDHLWILAEEAKALRSGAVPESLRLRILRFTLVDAVRGEPDFWSSAQIESERLTTIEREGTYTVQGAFAMKSARQSLKGTLQLALTFDGDKVASAKGYADCVASGSGTWTPGAPEGEFPLKFAFVLAPATKDTVPPQAAMFGREYLTGQ
jgi:hypothetical protein